jgi:hypothetical protein
MPLFKPSLVRKVHIWPDGTYCDDNELEGFLQWKSDDYRTVEITDVFDLERQLFEDDTDAAP